MMAMRRRCASAAGDWFIGREGRCYNGQLAVVFSGHVLYIADCNAEVSGPTADRQVVPP